MRLLTLCLTATVLAGTAALTPAHAVKRIIRVPGQDCAVGVETGDVFVGVQGTRVVFERDARIVGVWIDCV